MSNEGDIITSKIKCFTVLGPKEKSVKIRSTEKITRRFLLKCFNVLLPDNIDYHSILGIKETISQVLIPISDEGEVLGEQYANKTFLLVMCKREKPKVKPNGLNLPSSNTRLASFWSGDSENEAKSALNIFLVKNREFVVQDISFHHSEKIGYLYTLLYTF